MGKENSAEKEENAFCLASFANHLVFPPSELVGCYKEASGQVSRPSVCL